MRITEILEYLKKNSTNYIEYFEAGKICRKNYTQVHTDVLKLVSYIKRKGINNFENIGLIGSNTYEWILVDLACLAGGWVSFSFHEKNFENKVEELVSEYKLSLLFCDEKYYKNINDSENFVNIKGLLEVIKDEEIAIFEDIVFGDGDTFTHIFTSGTTGFPKNLLIMVDGVSEFINDINRMFKFNKEDKVIIFLPLSVFTCKVYVYGAILLGFNVVVCSIDKFAMVIKRTQPTILQGVPHLFETIHDTFYNMLKDSFLKVRVLKVLFYLNDHNLIPKFLMKKIQDKVLKEFKDFWGGKMRLMITGSASISSKVLKFYRNMGVNLYEAYATNEAGLISINYPGRERIGSVGTPLANRNVKLSEEGEILVKTSYVSQGYGDDSEELNKQIYREDGYLSTGDIGYFDKDGYLYIKGRKKDVITLCNGEKVLPGLLENLLKDIPYIKQAMVLGDNKPFLSCIVTRINDTVTKDMIDKEVSNINSTLTEVNKIKGVVLTKEPFSMENGQLNVNLKLNRENIIKVYDKELSEIYK